ncbi:MAG: RluA family pseudouridine synthase [Tepidisphaera sp.]
MRDRSQPPRQPPRKPADPRKPSREVPSAPPTPHADPVAPSDADESVSVGGVTASGGPSRSLILRGGKVDPEAILAAIEQAGQDAGEDTAEDETEGLRTVEFTLQRDLGKRLDKYLTDRITFMSRNRLQKLIDEGEVLVNGKPAKASHKVGLGDVVRVVVPPPTARGAVPEEIAIDILYEDEFMIVLNKQPDIIVHPARSHLSGTLINALAWHFKNKSKLMGGGGGALSGVGEEFARPGVVHRLDRDTSGCIVFAKQDEAHWKLGHQFEHRRVDKRYLALVHGWVEPVVQTIEFPLGPHPSRERGLRERQVVRHDEGGKPATTICRVRERFSLTPRPDVAPPLPDVAEGWNPISRTPRNTGGIRSDCYSLVELELKTGRTHQIRVHLSHLGWPIVGDDMYGGKPFLMSAKDGSKVSLERQALHAAILGITHPVTEQKHRFTAPIRGEFGAVVKHLRDLCTREGTHEHTLAPGQSGATVDIVV